MDRNHHITPLRWTDGSAGEPDSVTDGRDSGVASHRQNSVAFLRARTDRPEPNWRSLVEFGDLHHCIVE